MNLRVCLFTPLLLCVCVSSLVGLWLCPTLGEVLLGRMQTVFIFSDFFPGLSGRDMNVSHRCIELMVMDDMILP